jgi:branched-chain amino acid transport system substrate-binding protein
MNSKKKIAIGVVASAVVVALVVGIISLTRTSGSSSNSSTTMRLGLEAPLTGSLSVLGKGMLEGAELAASQLNAKGGILGKQVEIIPINDAGDATTGVAAAQKAIANGLDGVVGPYNSSVGVKTLPLYLKAGLVPIRLTSDNATDSMGFTLQPMTSQIAPAASSALTTWLKASSVAIIYDSTQNYTVTVANSLKTDLQKAGVTITAFAPITPGQSNYTSVVNQVAGTNPQVIYNAVYSPEGGLIAQEMYQEKTRASCLADYASYSTDYITVAGVPAAQACPVVGVPSPQDFPHSASYVASYQSMFHAAPGSWSPYTYDSVNFWAYGVKQVGGLNASSITSVLNKVNGWMGWTGSVTIDPTTENRQPATVVVNQVTPEGTFIIDASWATASGF